MTNTPLSVLESVFGYTEFRPMQAEIIDSLIAGRDNFVLMPTGGGKSLCYQIPALILPGLTIVVSPLIALMQDQVSNLQHNGVNAAYLNSSLSTRDYFRVLDELDAGEIDVLYVAPEKLLTEDFLDRCDNLELSLFAIDEAHCISQWGPDFRPEYSQLSLLRTRYPKVPLVALTATADLKTREDIKQCLGLEKADYHCGSFNRPNIRYTVTEKTDAMAQIKPILQTYSNETGIIYCATRKNVEKVATKIQNLGILAAPYHAGLSAEVRRKTQDEFKKDKLQVIVATIAFGMGIDKPNIRFVIHHDLPKNIEAYYQETGRAGRDGESAEALLLYGLGDIYTVKAILEHTENPELKRIEDLKFRAMTAYAEAKTCRRKVMLNYFSEDLAKDCGNCDICLNPPETYDATEDAQKALSCIYRVGQRFGVHHVIDVLMGSLSQKIQQYAHTELSTFGIGKHYTKNQWLSIFRQLIHHGLIYQDLNRYAALCLTEKARSILQGKEMLLLAKPENKISKPKSTRKTKADPNLEYNEQLYESLRQLRRKLADSESVPPFMIFSDASLREMAALMPKDNTEFLNVHGVGQHKLEKYGAVFMALINKETVYN